MNMDSQRLRMVADGMRRTRRTPLRGPRGNVRTLAKRANANTVAIDADGKDLATRGGGGFFYTSSLRGLNEQRHTTAATRSANLSAKSAGFPCSRNNAVYSG